MVTAKQSRQPEGRPEVSLKNFRDTDTDFCGCGEPKRVSHQRCKKCRQKPYRNSEKVRSRDRIRKKVIATQIPRVITITRKSQELAALAAYARTLPEDQCEMVLKRGGWSVRSLDKPTVRDVPEATVRIKVSSRPQVASALKPWSDGFLPEAECKFLLKERTRIPAYENGVPVDMSQESSEVKQWRDEKAKRLSAVLGELARAEARKREKRKQDAHRTE